MKFLLVVLVCGHFDCHYDRLGTFDTKAECYKAAGYDTTPPLQTRLRRASFRCIELTNG